MEYLNGAVRSTANTVAFRLAQEIASEQSYLRIQTGYFSLNGLSALKLTIDHLVTNDLRISIAIGANEKATNKSDVDALYTMISGSRANTQICVISCIGGLFHPKVVHLTRTDGSQLAYVGSANATPAGFNGANIEAGILLDSRTGDRINILEEIAEDVDEWFKGVKIGITHIASPATTQQLVNDGILGVIKQIVSSGSPSGSGPTASKMPLKALVSYPPLGGAGQVGGVGGPPGGSGSTITSPPTSTVPLGSPEFLVAEIGAGSRWKQANFPYSIVQNYFGMNPTGNGFLDLIPVAANGAPSATVGTKVVHVTSQNYRLELSAASGVKYPVNGRPIAVFRNVSGGAFRYRLFYPPDPGYSALNAGLATLYKGPAHQLKRVTMDSATLSSIWSNCPV